MRTTYSERFGAVLFAAIVVTAMIVGAIAIAGPPASAAEEEESDVLVPGPVNTTGTIETPGVYTLTTDIDLGGTNVTAFEIAASGVVLDGQGHTISNGTAEAIHINGKGQYLSDVTVTNLTIRDVESGISVMDVRDGEFSHLTVESVGDAGIVFAGRDTMDNLVDDVTIADDEKGIFLREGTSSITIQNSLFDSNHEVAIKASGSSDNRILNNTFTGQDGEKTIHLTGKSPDTVIRNNTIIDSVGPENAIQIGGESSGAVVDGNVVANNGEGGISADPDDITITNNVVSGNLGTGISVSGTGSTVSGNLVYDNQYGIALLGSDVSGHDNEVRDNALWDVHATEGGTDNKLSSLVIDGDDTTVSIMSGSVDFDLKGVETAPPLPAHFSPIGSYANVSTTSESGTIVLQFHYIDEELGASVVEENLTAIVYDGDGWTVVPGATVDVDANVVTMQTDAAGILAIGCGDITAPIADAGPDQTVLVNETVSFDGTNSTDDRSVVSYEWDFGDDTNATGPTPTHVYDTPGNYTVTLTVADATGNSDTDDMTVTVLEADETVPIADAGANQTVAKGEVATFDGSNSTDDVEIATYEWDFGDDTNATGATVTHVYDTLGTYTVTLTVTDTSGNVGTDTATVEVVADTEPPVADAGADQYVRPGVDATFDGTNSTDNVGIVTYEWTFGDETNVSTGATVTHAYAAAGTYTVTLTVWDAAGNEANDTLDVTVDDTAPVADAGPATRSVQTNTALAFDASASSDDSGTIASYEWDFGDDATATGVTTSHAYATAGTYTVTLTVTDPAGNVASTTVQVTVTAPVTPPADDDGSDDSSSSGSSGSSSSGSSSSSSSGSSGGSSTPTGPDVDVTYPNGTTAQVAVQNQGVNETVRVQFRQNDEACVALESMQFRARETNAMQLRVHQTTGAPDGVTTWQTRAGDPAFGYIGVDHDAAVDQGQLTFRVRTQCLENAGVDPAHVRLYRYQDGEWVALQTRLLSQNETQIRYQADTPGFSTFAVGAAESDIAVTDASLGATTIQAGETATLDVVLANDGDLDGTYTVDLSSDGTVLETMDVTVAAGTTTAVSLTHRFDTAGEYAISSGGVTAGTLTVEAASEPPTVTTATETPAADEPPAGLSTGTVLGGLFVLLALALGAYLIYREGSQE